MKYSIKKGLQKGLTALIPGVIMILTFAGISADLTIWELLETYLKPILGGTTIIGAMTMFLNWLKVRAKIGRAKK